MHVSLLIFASCCAASVLAGQGPYYPPEEAEKYFENFITKFNKHYDSEEEKAARLEIFKVNLEKINKSNKETNITIYDITQFSDLTIEEFIEKHTGLLPADKRNGYGACSLVTDEGIPNVNAPDAFDWRSRNAVTPAKNQGGCGSCYAFSAMGQLESQYAIKYGQFIDLSEQEGIDCCTACYGCQGGFPSWVFETLMSVGGAMVESSYPYKGWTYKQCRANPNQASVRVGSCSSYNLQSQEKVKQLLYSTGPISICIQAQPLHSYGGGIVHDEKCVGDINHAVLLVGYGTDSSNNMPYWVVKNSWGDTWGEGGYFRLQRSEQPQGACQMLNDYMATAVIA